MIEIRELIIRANVTKNANGANQHPQAASTKKENSALKELMRGINDKNER